MRLRSDYDPTTTYRARLFPFDAIRREQKINMSIFRRSLVVVVSQSNRNCNHGLSCHNFSRPGRQVSAIDAENLSFLREIVWPSMMSGPLSIVYCTVLMWLSSLYGQSLSCSPSHNFRLIIFCTSYAYNVHPCSRFVMTMLHYSKRGSIFTARCT